MSKINRENITIGKGQCYFKAKGETGYRPFGNTPNFAFTVTTETLKHFDSRKGVRTQDREVQVEVSYGGSFTADHIQSENMAIFLQGDNNVVAVAGATDTEITFEDVKLGYMYELGSKNVAGVTGVKGATPLVLNTDYSLDVKNGTVTLLPDSTVIIDGDDVEFTFDITAHSYERVSSGAKVIEGSFRFVADNPEGENKNFLMADVKITPNGDFSVITEEWQNLPFTLLISAPTGGSAITCDGEPYTP